MTKMYVIEKLARIEKAKDLHSNPKYCRDK